MTKYVICFILMACGPQEPGTTTENSSSTTIMETFGNSTSTSGTTEVIPTSTSSTTFICEPGVGCPTTTEPVDCGSGIPLCPDMGGLKEDFEPCHDSMECEGGICITNDTGASFCTSSCNDINHPCKAEDCFGENFCVIFCETTKDCPDKMFCQPFFEKKVCFAI